MTEPCLHPKGPRYACERCRPGIPGPERRPPATRRWAPPVVIPPGWYEHLTERSPCGGAWDTPYNLRIMATCATERDGREWVHVSVSHRTRVPTWEEFRDAVRFAVGDREAYIVLPPKERYVNVNPHVLHAFACLDGAILPDFRVAPGVL